MNMVHELPPKPLPVVTDLTRPFWIAAREGRLVLQRCGRCATFNFYPKPWCVECGSRDLVWMPAKGRGTVYSHTVSLSVAMNYPGWDAELPLIMCLVDLDEGARMYAQVTNCLPEDVHIGMPLEVYFEAITPEFGIPKFRPVDDNG
jgi:uncharacterized OB-fold protein